MLRLLAYDWVEPLFVSSKFRFHYWGFDWVPRLASPAWAHACCWTLAALALALALGLWTRLVAAAFLLGFVFLQLSDATNYLNHCYLVILLTGLLAFSPAGRVFSLDTKPQLQTLPALWLYLFRFQVAIVYLFAAVAKLNSDWLLNAQPLRMWLTTHGSLPILGQLLSQPLTAHVLSWTGLLFDACVPWLLLTSALRIYAFGALALFHIATALLFPIGMFPWIMLAASSVFLPADWTWPRARSVSSLGSAARLSRSSYVFSACYVTLQLLVPLRCFLYRGDVHWHEQGMRFAWRVMAREKYGHVSYQVHSPQLARQWEVLPESYLSARQMREMSGQPELILQLAHAIARDFAARGLGPVEVRASALASLNGRPSAPLVDPSVDLSKVKDSLLPARWIMDEPRTH